MITAITIAVFVIVTAAVAAVGFAIRGMLMSRRRVDAAREAINRDIENGRLMFRRAQLRF